MTVREIKQAIRLSLDDNAHDEQLLNYIDAATEQVEHDCTIALIDQTFEYTRDAWPRDRFLLLPVRPATSVVEITYIDNDGNVQTMPAEDYRLDMQQNQVVLARNATWPLSTAEGITVEYVAGYGEDSRRVPAVFRSAIAMQVGKWWQNPTMDLNELITGSDRPYERLVGRYMRSSWP